MKRTLLVMAMMLSGALSPIIAQDYVTQRAPEQVEMSSLAAPAISTSTKNFIKKWQSPEPPAIASAGKGEITIKAVVSETGEILNASIQYRVLQRLDEDALNLVRSLPAIEPGTQDGSAVTMNVVFGIRYFPLQVTIKSYSVRQ